MKSGVGGVGVDWAHALDNTLQVSDLTNCSEQFADLDLLRITHAGRCF
jgi:hypothetical protein